MANDWRKFSSQDWQRLIRRLRDYGSRFATAVLLLRPDVEYVLRGGKSISDFVSELILDLLSGIPKLGSPTVGLPRQVNC